MSFFQQFILGLIQGVFEWLPFSSEGVLLLVSSNIFQQNNLELFLRQALFLHLGTFFAALIYFRKDVARLTVSLFNYKNADSENKKILNFLILTTLISGVIGLAVLQFLELTSDYLITTSKTLTITVGFLLLFTGLLQIKSRSAGNRTPLHLNQTDSIFLGVMQGIAVLPGLSRSGLTVSSLLFRNIDDKTALRLSFLMSLPIVLAGNILLNFSNFELISDLWIGVIFAFFFGLITINLFMKLAEKVKFGWFVIIIALMTILAGVFVPVPVA